MDEDDSRSDKLFTISSVLKKISDFVLNHIFLGVVALLGAVYLFLTAQINDFVDHRIERVVSNMITDKLNDEGVQKLSDKERLRLGVTNTVQTILKNKAGQVSVDKIILDSKNKEAAIQLLANPGSTIWLMLQVEGLKPNDKILMTDADTGYKKKISKNGSRYFNMNIFLKKSDEYVQKKEEGDSDPGEAKSDVKYFGNLRKISFTLRPSGSEEVRPVTNQVPKKDEIGKNAVPQVETPQVELSYIMLTYPPLSVTGLTQSKDEEQGEGLE
jgi:hypothetical protein